MKKSMRIIAFTLAVVMLAGMTFFTAAADEADMITVSLRIEGDKENLYYNTAIRIAAGSTVHDLMALVNEMEEAPEIVMQGSDEWGTYIVEIDGLAAGDYGGASGWNLLVSDVSPTVGQSFVVLEDLDDVVYYYGDPVTNELQAPVMDLTRLYSDGIITFTSFDTTWDEEFNSVVTENPVVGAKVEFEGVIYLTDSNGCITIESTVNIAGLRTFSIERYDEETGIPTLLRSAPYDYIYIRFSDVQLNTWYDNAVFYGVLSGLFVGTDQVRNTFEPLRKMTMAELITVLARFTGVEVSGTDKPWYAPALYWGIVAGIVGEGFEPGAPVTREEFIHMFYMTAAEIGTYDMDVRADITGAIDIDDINEDYLEAVSWAVASKIIIGTSADAELKIDPTVQVDRATVCQMLLNYYDNN